jgi:hypothetical protein
MIRSISLMIVIVCAALAGCATNRQFADDKLPATHISGEEFCQLPQSWKALALSGVDTQSLTRARVVQIKIPAEWVGDTLGWFVEGEDTRTSEQYPRYGWQALVVNERTGEKRFFPAVMENPLTFPVLTVIITDPSVQDGEELNVYVSSGAHTKLLTVSGETLRLFPGKGCLEMVDSEFVRQFPSKARAIEITENGAGARLLARLRKDFTTPARFSVDEVYSLHSMALNPRVVGDLRQVTLRERTAERGLPLSFPPGPGTAISLGVAFYHASDERYTGPFGERQYSAPEASVALKRYLRAYSLQRRELETRLRIPSSGDHSFNLDFDGRKSGWEIGEGLAPRIRELWQELNQLKERLSFRTNGQKGGAVQEEVVRFGLLPSSSPP